MFSYQKVLVNKQLHITRLNSHRVESTCVGVALIVFYLRIKKQIRFKEKLDFN